MGEVEKKESGAVKGEEKSQQSKPKEKALGHYIFGRGG